MRRSIVLLASLVVSSLPAIAFGAAPAAVNDTYTVNEDATLTVPAATGVLANDLANGNSPIVPLLRVKPATGRLVLHADGSFVYTPARNVNGVVTFKYKTWGGGQPSNEATVTINITPVNDLPVGVIDAYYVDPGSILFTGGIAGVPGIPDQSWPNPRDNDFEAEGVLTLTGANLTAPPAAAGTLDFFAPDTHFKFTASGNVGATSFTYQLTDTNGATSTSTINIGVGVPVAGGANLTTLSGQAINNYPLPVASTSFYTLTYDIHRRAGARHVVDDGRRSIHLHAGGRLCRQRLVRVSPRTTAPGRRSGRGLSDGDAAAGDRASADAHQSDVFDEPDTPFISPFPGVLTGAADADGDPLYVLALGPPTKGSVALSTNGGFTYTPNFHAVGGDSFDYLVLDGVTPLDETNATMLSVFAGSATVNLLSVAQPPVANPETYSIGQDTALDARGDAFDPDQKSALSKNDTNPQTMAAR